MDKKKLRNEQGKCPRCHSYNLDYDPAKFEGDQMCYYHWTCRDCKLEGEEWYRMEFAGHNVFTEDGDVVEL